LSAKGSLNANHSGCGEYTVHPPSQLETVESHVFWFALAAQEVLSTATFLMQ